MLGVSVVISTYTSERLPCVLRCISSLKRQTFPPAEVILVLDPNERLVRFFKSRMPSDVRIVVSDHVGLSCARNTGVKNARGTIVAFIDDDATADKSWLEKLVQNYEDPEVIGAGGLIKAVWEDKRPVWFPEELDWIVGCSYKGLPETRSTTRNPIGCNMSFRKTAFEKIGYFRSDIGRLGKKLLANEETELSLRILRRIPNSKIIFEPSAIVYHRVDKNRERFGYIWTRSFYEGVSKALISSDAQSSNLLTTLSTEDTFLKHLLQFAIPSRVKQIYRFENICQSLVLLFSMFAVFGGFALYRLGRRGSEEHYSSGR